MASIESYAPERAQTLCLCQGHQTFPNCTILTLVHLTCMLDALSLLPYLRLLESVNVTLYRMCRMVLKCGLFRVPVVL